MKVRFLTILLIVISLFSCAKEGFVVNTVDLSHETVFEDGVKTKESVLFKTTLSEDGKYELILSDPENNLTFNCKLNKDGEYYISDDLRITSLSSFSVGEYKYTIIKDEGTEAEGIVLLDYDSVKPLTINDNDIILEAYQDGKIIAETSGPDYPKDADTLVLTKRDSKNNNVITTISLSSSDHLP